MPRRCLPGCECKRHSLRNSGQFQKTASREAQIEQFWEYVDKGPEHWVWTGPTNHNGYGRFAIWGLFDNDNQKNAHVISFVLAGGILEPGKQIDHTCKIRLCVNPECLEQVTSVVNVRRSSVTKLDEKKVMIIRLAYRYGQTQREIADQFDIGQTAVSKIVNRKRWK